MVACADVSAATVLFKYSSGANLAGWLVRGLKWLSGAGRGAALHLLRGARLNPCGKGRGVARHGACGKHGDNNVGYYAKGQ